ncbi:MAG: helix-hairpin-helix domain-containing protein [Planctomycetes bacterium]|nr:helix-hairpin-helix domain-containing protein [Planctomycetota bacterium]
MPSEAILRRLEAEFDVKPETIRAVVDLLADGASPCFVATFRREATDRLPESRVTEIAKRFHHLEDLEQRKAAIGEKLAQNGNAVDLGDFDLAECFDRELLDDIDHVLRPHEMKQQSALAERGLEEFAKAIESHDIGDKSVKEAAEAYVSEEKQLPSADAVLEVVVRALAEKYGEDPLIRRELRDELSRGILQASVKDPAKAGKKSSARYAEFFEFSEPVRKIAAQRMIALRKAEREGVLAVRLNLPENREVELFRRRFSPDVDPASPLGELLDLIYRLSYDAFAHSRCEATVRHELKEIADRETVSNLARSLRSQLLGPALGPHAAIAVRASNKSLWLASVKADGSLGPRHTLSVADPEHHGEVAKVIAETIDELEPRAIALPHGRGLAAAAKHVEAALALRDPAKPRPFIVQVDETAAMVYATSANARRKLPGTDTGMRATISLVRRLSDPLRELTRIEPRGLGLGQNLTEVHQGILHRTLDSITSSCVAHAGIDLNRTDTDFLARLPGLDRDKARAIVEHRSKHGKFDKVEDLRALEAIDDRCFEQIAGFVRVHGGSQPLDATPIHPESYPIAEAAAAVRGVGVAELIGTPNRDIELEALCERAGCSRDAALDTLRSLASGESDVRGTVDQFDNPNVSRFEDLTLDQELRGRITNMTDFGAFVDLGIGSDGLVHVSQVAPNRRGPDATLRVGEVIPVYVVGIDPKAKKISLSMHKPRHVADGRAPTIGERLGGNKGARRRGRRERGPREEAPMNRAAREPEGRRGGRRGAPKSGDRDRAPSGERSGGGGRGRPGRDRDRPRGEPRVYTIESSREAEQSLGHKGELRSLAGLRSLLQSENTTPDHGAKPDSDS